MKCHNCGMDISNEASFCTNCGAKVEIKPDAILLTLDGGLRKNRLYFFKKNVSRNIGKHLFIWYSYIVSS